MKEKAQELFRFRFAICLAIVFPFWVLLVKLLAPESIAGNAMRLDSYYLLGFTTFLNLSLAILIVSIFRLLNHRYRPSTIGNGSLYRRWVGDGLRPWGLPQYVFSTAMGWATPLSLVVIYGDEFPYNNTLATGNQSLYFHIFLLIICLVFPLAPSLFLLAIVGRTKSFLFGSEEGSCNYLPFEAINSKGRIKSLNTWPAAIDFQFLIYFIFLVGFHYILTQIIDNSFISLISVPLVASLLIWVVFTCLIACAYWLDKLSIPTLPALLLAILAVNAFFDQHFRFQTVTNPHAIPLRQHFTTIEDAERSYLSSETDFSRIDNFKDAANGLENEAWKTVQNRIKHLQPGQRIAVVVTCLGGGIHAAAWCSFVLEKLIKKFTRFRDCITVISSVSGGSVGSLYYNCVAFASEISDDEDLRPAQTAFDLSTESSLESIAVGMMSDDFYGVVFPPLSRIDRGQRLENALLSRLPPSVGQQSMGSWTKIATDGNMPITVFNTTDAVTGKRVLFDNIPTPFRASNIGLTSRPYNFRELLSLGDPDTDVLPATAVRISASFPYVSTFVSPAKPSAIGKQVALGDGGYVDNEGIVSALDWIQFILEKSREEDVDAIDKILLLRIMPSVSSDSLSIPSSGAMLRHSRWLTGPVETMLNARSTSQTERGNLETDLAAEAIEQAFNQTAANATSPNVSYSLKSVSPQFRFVRSGNKTRNEAAKERFKNQENSMGVPPFAPSLNKAQPQTYSLPNNEEEILNDYSSSTVIEIQIPYESDNDARVIPLNWKLTAAQKLWYEDAWKRIEANQVEDLALFAKLFGASDGSQNP